MASEELRPSTSHEVWNLIKNYLRKLGRRHLPQSTLRMRSQGRDMDQFPWGKYMGIWGRYSGPPGLEKPGDLAWGLCSSRLPLLMCPLHLAASVMNGIVPSLSAWCLHEAPSPPARGWVLAEVIYPLFLITPPSSPHLLVFLSTTCFPLLEFLSNSMQH
jgi:hypothetical protein